MTDDVSRQRSELMIALVPHVIRRPEFTAENLRAIDVGTQNAIKLSYAPKPEDQAPAPAAPVAKPEQPAGAPAAVVTPAVPPGTPVPATAPPPTARMSTPLLAIDSASSRLWG